MASTYRNGNTLSLSTSISKNTLGSSAEFEEALKQLSNVTTLFSNQATDCERLYKSQAEVRRLVSDKHAFSDVTSTAQIKCAQGITELAAGMMRVTSMLENIWACQIKEIDGQTLRLESAIERVEIHFEKTTLESQGMLSSSSTNAKSRRPRKIVRTAAMPFENLSRRAQAMNNSSLPPPANIAHNTSNAPGKLSAGRSLQFGSNSQGQPPSSPTIQSNGPALGGPPPPPPPPAIQFKPNGAGPPPPPPPPPGAGVVMSPIGGAPNSPKSKPKELNLQDQLKARLQKRSEKGQDDSEVEKKAPPPQSARNGSEETGLTFQDQNCAINSKSVARTRPVIAGPPPSANGVASPNKPPPPPPPPPANGIASPSGPPPPPPSTTRKWNSIS
ncbi:hypothetical protein BASA60_004779 [Batrachochytrium salamandrivorans]|nr:hypothetical protein BASA60_004779 [Batrachochytrium salamandrivorans]